MPEVVAASGAAPHYTPPRLDGGRPGTFWFNTERPTAGTGWDIEAVAYHEAVPGHHLQLSRLQLLTDLPALQRQRSITVFSEGWGLYAEQLGKDVGFYQDPYSDFGRLEDDIWRAVRLVVDTGVHAKHWSREQMVDYFHQHSGIGETDVQAEVDRYIAWPSQALGYKVGQLKFLELRAKAQQALGDRFKLSAFHDQVIDSGALPLDTLGERIDSWIAQQKTQK